MNGIQTNSSRDLHLDFVKGILVIVMVIYHIMNYFSNASPTNFGYVRFVSGSFIFVSGYTISTFYEKKYRINRNGISRRLFIRGLKLLTIFTALNLLINLTGIGNPRKALGIEQYLDNLNAIYVSGNGKFAAFQILLPISYLLMVSPAFLFLNGFSKLIIISTLAVVFYFLFLDIDSANLGLCLIGVIGISAGMAINKIERPFSLKNRWLIFCCLALSIYFMGYLSRNAMTYSIAIMIVLKLLYDLAKTVSLSKQANQLIILLGQYTLVCYIMQIVFLQGLSRALPKQKWGLGYETIAIFIITNIFLWGLCGLVKFLRDRYESSDKAYRFIFS
jgi:hypothetical protein